MNPATSTHIACPHCHATNRVPSGRLGDDPVCGRCGRPLLDGRPVELGDADFDRVAAASGLPVVVDFWAPWCGPCQQMAPQFEQAARTLKGRALLVKVNSDDNPLTASRFGIRSIPTLVKLDHGREVARVAGARPAGQIVQFAQG
ncbi:MAG TPA: thioredoxin TrxC [Rubrivivax sp.]|nr:thioredoxin TrxC [Rubrivivax sp.]HPO20334.1 thioredoxin TrxC [Rubrivivax sp.]